MQMRLTVALSVGVAIVLGIFRILKGWPIQYLIIGGYVVVGLMTSWRPRRSSASPSIRAALPHRR